jgi:hypothetical protein
VLAQETFFAPAGRDTAAEFQAKMALLGAVPLLSRVLDAMPGMVVVLNARRQIVAANRAFHETLEATQADVLEKRPGEAVGCLHAPQGPDGCGTALYCVTCGAVQAILESIQTGSPVVRECRILVQSASGAAPLDLRVTATPFDVGQEQFIMAALDDISHQKRIAVLQRTFFHDVLNTAGCLLGLSQHLAARPRVEPELFRDLESLSQQLVEEIQCQRDLIAAESGDLHTDPAPLRPQAVLEDLRAQYLHHPMAAGRQIAMGPAWEGTLRADRRLLDRVLGNMLKNALEAVPPSGVVTLACGEAGDAVTFTIHNPGVMTDDVQLQVFYRSFTTKGQPGRGIGTYSMKLFGERYLHGKVDFTSRPPEGTTFRIVVPKSPPAAR